MLTVPLLIAEACYTDQQPTSLRTISQPSFGRHSAEAAMTTRPTGLARLSAALGTPGAQAPPASLLVDGHMLVCYHSVRIKDGKRIGCSARAFVGIPRVG